MKNSMGLGIDLQDAAARPADYYDIFADPRDDEAPPVWGYRAPSRWSRMSEEERIGYPLLIASFLVMALLGGAYLYVEGLNTPSFAVGVAGHDGIDLGRPDRVVSPAFGVTIRMNWTCAGRADVVVSYAGVALGWARAEPWDCEGKRRDKTVEVVARGEGVGLPEHLRDHMATEWRRSGALELDVDVGIFDDSVVGRRAAGEFPQKVMTCRVRLHGHKSETLPCAWYFLEPGFYD